MSWVLTGFCVLCSPVAENRIGTHFIGNGKEAQAVGGIPRSFSLLAAVLGSG